MSKIQIIIDGVRADLNESENPTFAHISNFMGDINKINQSHSYTINLPRTHRNNKIFNFAERPAVMSSFPRSYHRADFLRNGVLIFTGRAVLLSTNEKAYSIFLIWSTIERLVQLKEAGNINVELLEYEKNLDWTPETQTEALITNGTGLFNRGYGFLKYYYGRPFDLTPNIGKGLSPCVSLSYLLDKIGQKYGINFIFNNIENYGKLKQLFLLATGEKSSIEGEIINESFTIPSPLRIKQRKVDYKPVYFDLPSDAIRSLQFVAGNTVPYIGFIKKQGIEKDFDIDITVSGYFTNSFSVAKVDEGGLGAMVGTLYPTIAPSNGYKTGKIKINTSYLNGNEYFAFIIPTMSSSETMNVNILVESKWTPDEDDLDDLNFPSIYPLIQNLPEIKVLDMLKNMFDYLNVYPYRNNNDDSNTIRLLSISDILDNKPNAYNWSQNLVGEITEITYRYSDFAQKNLIDYKQDDNLHRNGETGYLYVNDETLERSKDFLKFIFASTPEKLVNFREGEDTTRQAVIPQYDENWESQNLPPVLLSAKTGSNRLSFTDNMIANNLTAQNFAALQSLISQPLVIKVRLKLSEFDLKNLDFARPVYLSQPGRHYIIIKITDYGKSCELEAIQIP